MAKRILVVEDDKMLCHLFEMFVKDLGYELIGVAHTSEDAFLKCEAETPDVILMDVHLKGETNGIEAAKIIHQKFDTPVIFITSDSEQNTVKEAIHTNTYGFLVKPIHKTSLGLVIELAYYKHRYDKELKVRERKNYAAIDVSQKPIIVVANGKIEYANLKGLELFNVETVEDLMGKEFIAFVDEESRADWEKIAGDTYLNDTKINIQSKIKVMPDDFISIDICGEAIEFNHKTALKLTMSKS